MQGLWPITANGGILNQSGSRKKSIMTAVRAFSRACHLFHVFFFPFSWLVHSPFALICYYRAKQLLQSRKGENLSTYLTSLTLILIDKKTLCTNVIYTLTCWCSLIVSPPKVNLHAHLYVYIFLHGKIFFFKILEILNYN